MDVLALTITIKAGGTGPTLTVNNSIEEFLNKARYPDMENTKRNFFSISRRDLASLPILVFAPLLAYHYPSLLIFIVLLYLIAGIITGYVWPCVTTLLGAVFIGLFFGPSVNGDVYQDIVRFSLGAVLGLAFGMLLHELRQDKPEKPD